MLGSVAPSASAADTYGYGVPGPVPTAVAAPGKTTLAYSVTPPAGGGVSTFTLHRSRTINQNVIVGLALGMVVADDGVDPDTPTLTVTGARLDGPGTLTALPIPAIAGIRRGCIRNGELTWGAEPGYQLQLRPGETTRILVDVSIPAGGYVDDPALELTPRAWQPNASSPAGAVGGPVQIIVPRSSGRTDSIRFTAVKSGARQRLAGTVSPARRGQRVQIIGRPVTKASQAAAYHRLPAALGSTVKRQRILATTTTDAQGGFDIAVKLPSRMAVLARTTRGQAGITTAGASCPLVLSR